MSFQNRLAYYQDKRNSRLIRNSAQLTGIYTDIILVDHTKNSLQDITATVIKEVSFVPVIFPYASLDDSEVRQSKTSEGKIVTHLTSGPDASFKLYVAANQFIDKDDYLFWVIEDHSYSESDIEMEAVLLLLKVKGLKAKFGAAGIVYKQYDCTLENPSTLPQKVIDLLVEAHEKRTGSFLTDQNRIQIEP